MIRIIAMWDGWNTPTAEADLWLFLCRDFAIPDLVMVPDNSLARKGLREKAGLAEAVNEARADDLTIVRFSEKGDTHLNNFEHPENVAYVFGRASRNPSIDGVDVTVRIETTCARGLIWGHQAAAIALYDRERKSWQ